MACNYNSWFYLMCFFFLARVATSSPFISNDVLESHGRSGRALLQVTKECNVSFANANYTVLTTNCKGPQYPAKQCCEAFKVFACPYAEAINDMETNCATSMFSYINLYGKYPPGLFANECKEGKNGLDCTAMTEELKKNGGAAQMRSSLLMMFTAGLLVLLFQLF